MLTYALFIATDPDPVSSSTWEDLDLVFDRARLSSGGTKVHVRATEGAVTGAGPADFELDVATFVNGTRLEVRDDGPAAFTFIGDGVVLGTAELGEGQWLLTRDPAAAATGGEAKAYLPADGHTRGEAEQRLGKVVEDWLT